MRVKSCDICVRRGQSHKKSANCMLKSFKLFCKLMGQVEDKWESMKLRFPMTFDEAKFLVLHPGTWIRPHFASNGQALKMHMGLR